MHKMAVGQIKNILLRRLALAYYPNASVASLTGGDWLKFLDESGNTLNFTRGAGRILIEAPYRSGKLENYNGDEFIPLIRKWVIKTSRKVGGCLCNGYLIPKTPTLCQ